MDASSPCSPACAPGQSSAPALTSFNDESLPRTEVQDIQPLARSARAISSSTSSPRASPPSTSFNGTSAALGRFSAIPRAHALHLHRQPPLRSASPPSFVTARRPHAAGPAPRARWVPVPPSADSSASYMASVFIIPLRPQRRSTTPALRFFFRKPIPFAASSTDAAPRFLPVPIQTCHNLPHPTGEDRCPCPSDPKLLAPQRKTCSNRFDAIFGLNPGFPPRTRQGSPCSAAPSRPPLPPKISLARRTSRGPVHTRCVRLLGLHRLSRSIPDKRSQRQTPAGFAVRFIARRATYTPTSSAHSTNGFPVHTGGRSFLEFLRGPRHKRFRPTSRARPLEGLPRLRTPAALAAFVSGPLPPHPPASPREKLLRHQRPCAFTKSAGKKVAYGRYRILPAAGQ